MARTRKQPVSAAYIEAVEKSLKERATALRAIRNAMAHGEMEDITVDGTGMLERSYGYIDAFIHSCKRELGKP